MRERTVLRRSLRRIVCGAVLIGTALLGLGVTPSAASAAERIDDYDVDMLVRENGALRITETIDYNFGSNRKHGIFRDVPVKFRYDETKNRVYPIQNVRVERDGEREEFERIEDDSMVRFKIGDPDEFVTGRHTYEISYTVRGALNRFDDHDELYWNAIGEGWEVPIRDASVTVRGPAPITQADCFAGPARSRLSCDRQSFDGRTATFQHDSLQPGQAFSVVVAFPADSVANPGPILEDRRDAAAAFRATPFTVTGAIVAALLGVGVVLFIAWRVGRDRVYVGQIPTLTPAGGQDGPKRRKSLWGAKPVTVQFTPPQGIRPGEVGTLLDERAHTLDVTATIIDFAVRRYLHIEEIPPEGRLSAQDWELTKLAEPDESMAPYEQTLFKALFSGRDSVRLSALKYTFASELTSVKRGLYSSVVRRRWYRASPEQTRNVAFVIGIAAVVAAAVATFVLYRFTHVALIGVGLIVAALVGLASAWFMPARTGRGSAALGQVLGFRQYLVTAEAGQIAYEEREEIFSRYLPYAIVFGIAERWAETFRDIGAVQRDGGAGLYWYGGAVGWNMAYFGSSIGSFNTVAAGTIASTPPSASGSSGFSGGGFSGGGGGGGGGGSW